MSQSPVFDDLLKMEFIQADVAPYGKVIVIPAKDFKDGWEERLRAEGHGVFSQAYAGGMAFLISFNVNNLRKVNNEHRQPIAFIKRPKQHRRKSAWDPEKEKRLLQRYAEVDGNTITAKIKALAHEFEGHSENALYQRLWKNGAFAGSVPLGHPVTPGSAKTTTREPTTSEPSQESVSTKEAVEEPAGHLAEILPPAAEFDDEMVHALKKDLLDIAQDACEGDCKTIIRALRYIDSIEGQLVN